MGEYKMQAKVVHQTVDGKLWISLISPVLHLKINQLKSCFNVIYEYISISSVY